MTAPLPTRPADHPAFPPRKIGVLVANLGTPDAPEPRAVKRYLREFLSDRRVVELPPILWQPILRGIVLNVRPKKSAHAYAQIWTDRGSPLAVHTQDIAAGLAARFADAKTGAGADARGNPQDGPKTGDAMVMVMVDWAMRYGAPSVAERVAALRAAGCDRLLFMPLYPQYSAATTASANDALFATLEALRWQPAVRTLPPYHDDPAYIAALAASARRHLATLDSPPEALLLSFHGMPQRTLLLGDPYHCQCVKTVRLLSEALADDFDGKIILSFQSRFGSAKWLEPATETVLAQLGQQGIRSVAVMAPGFSADCLETLEEIMLRGRKVFVQNSGHSFTYVPCLNASEDAITLYEGLARRELAGWTT